jgi:hypothetical protein
MVFCNPLGEIHPKTEIDFAYDPHRKGEERKSRFSNGISFLTP